MPGGLNPCEITDHSGVHSSDTLHSSPLLLLLNYQHLSLLFSSRHSLLLRSVQSTNAAINSWNWKQYCLPVIFVCVHFSYILNFKFVLIWGSSSVKFILIFGAAPANLVLFAGTSFLILFFIIFLSDVLLIFRGEDPFRYKYWWFSFMYAQLNVWGQIHAA